MHKWGLDTSHYHLESARMYQLQRPREEILCHHFVFVQVYQETLEIKKLTSKFNRDVCFTNITTIYRKHCCGLDSQKLQRLLGVYLREVRG